LTVAVAALLSVVFDCWPVPWGNYIPDCPPHPITILDGLLRLLGRIE
jgi:Ni,Fe-hydrogenase III small subunit